MKPKKSPLLIKKKSIATAFDSFPKQLPRPKQLNPYDYDNDFIPMDWPKNKVPACWIEDIDQLEYTRPKYVRSKTQKKQRILQGSDRRLDESNKCNKVSKRGNCTKTKRLSRKKA